MRGGASVLPPDGTGVRTATAAAPLALNTRIGLMKVVEGAATLRLSTRWDGTEAGTLTVNGAAAAARLGADEEADHVLDGLAPGEYVCQWTTGASTNLATFCVRGGASVLPPDGAGVRTATAAAIALDTRIGLLKVVDGAATLRLSTRWDGVPEGVLTVNGAEAARLGADAEADHVLDGLAPGEYVCSWTTGASTNLATFCVRGGASALPPDGAGVRTATASPVTLDTRIGLYKVLSVSERGVASAVCRLSTRWDGAPEGVLTVNGAAAARLGADAEAGHVLDGLAPGEYVCSWTTGASTNLATFCVRGGASVLPPDGAGVRTATAAAIALDTRIGLVKVVEDAATLRLSTRWDGVPEGVLTVNGAEAARLGAEAEADHVLDGLAPGEYVCRWTTGASTNLATFCVRGGASVLPPDGAGVRTATAAPLALDTRIGLYKVVPVSDRGVASAVCRLSTRWDGAESGTLTVNGEEVRALGTSEEVDHRMDNLAPGEYVCRWTAGDAAYLATFSVRGDGSARPPRTGVEVTITGHTATYPYDGCEKRAGGFVVTTSDPLYTADDFVFTGCSNAVRTAVGTTAFGMSASDFANVNPDFADVVFHVADGSVTVTPGAVVNPFDPDDPSAPPAPGALARADCVAVYDGEGHTISVAPLLNPALAADGAAVTYSPDPSRVPFAPENPVFTNAVSTSVWYRVASPNYAPFTTNALLEIRPRPVTLTSGTKTDFVYDGQPHGFPVLGKSENGFVAGEGVTASNWATVTAVSEGEVENTFDYAAQEGTDLANYELTVVTGKIAVVAAPPVTPDGPVDPLSPDPTDPSAPCSAYDFVGVYDGEAHTIDTNALRSVVYQPAAPLSFQYALVKDGALVDEPFMFTDVVSTSFWYRISAPNFADYWHEAKVTITNRPVTLMSGTKTDFVYNGAAHTCPHIMISGLGFVAGEGVTASNWATVTTVAEGEVANTFDYAPLGGTDLANYTVTVVTGKIAVVKAPIPVGPGGSIEAVGYTNVYDGAAHGIAVSANGLLTSPTVQYRANEADEWSDTSPVYANVCDTQVWYRVSAPNYAPVVGTVGVRITPRPVTLTSGNLTKPYDGTPLALTAADITADGLVDGESFTYSDFASRTEVGQTPATFSYAAGANTSLANYEITPVYGTLTVTRSATEIAVTAKSGSWVYDGQPHALHEYNATNLGTLQPGDALAVTFDAASVVTSPTDGASGDGRVENRIASVRVMRGDLDVSANYTLASYPGTLTVTKRPVTLTSKSAAKVYDGTPLMAHEVTVGGDGFAGEDGATYTFTGEQTAKGTSKNAFAYALKDGTNPAFYDITKVEGDLEVLAADIAQGDETDWQVVLGPTLTYTGAEQTQTLVSAMYKGLPLDCSVTGNAQTDAGTYQLTLTGKGNFTGEKTVDWSIAPKGLTLTAGSGLKVYDGTALTVNVVDAEGFVAGEGADFSCVGSQKDVGRSANEVDAIRWNANTKGSNYAVTKMPGTLTVTKRPVTLTSKSAAKTYDGMPLTAHEVAVGGDGFADDEGATYAFTGSQTAVGESANTFTYTLNANTAAGNYEIVTVNGRLTVTKATVGPGGGSEPGTDDVPTGGVSKFDATAVYDGEEHTIKTNELVAAFGATMVGAGETRIGYGYAADGTAVTGSEQVTDWREIAPVYTNAGEYVVWYRVTNPNYEDFVHQAKLTITPRPVTLTSGTKTDFVYDGVAHAYPQISVSGLGFVDGEGVTTSNWATVTAVAEGEVANTFNYVAQEGTDLANYEITVVTGQIAVVAAPIPVGPSGSIVAVGYTNAYDGAAHGVAVSAVGLLTTPTVQYRASEADEWADASPVYANVCDAQVWYRVSAPNYVPVVGTVGVRITPRPVTLTSKSATKPYDGMPLTAHEVAVGGDGFADDEGATYAFTGSQTAVGESANTFTYTLNANTAAGNYEIVTVNGRLTVTKATVGPGGGEEPGADELPEGAISRFDATAVYDGVGHTIDTNELQAAFGAAMVGASETCVLYGYVATGAAATGQEQRVDSISGAATGQEQTADLGAVATGPEQVADWRAVAPVYTNAGEYVVWYRVSNPNYENFIHAAKVTISKRPVTVRSRNLTKPYDGTPLRLTAGDIDAALTDGGQGLPALPEGESFAYGDFAERTAAGETEATFTVSAGANTSLSNYEITPFYGTLTVTPPPVTAVRVVFDALGGRIGSAAAVTQEVSGAYGELPSATRAGYLLAGWFLGITNGAPQAASGAALLADADHTLFAQWTVDPSFSPVVDANGDTIFRWEATGPSTAKIVGFKDPNQRIANVVIPDKIEGRFVTAIADGAFANSASGMADVVFPAFCTRIGERAFYNVTSLTSITFTDVRRWDDPGTSAGLTIGSYAFSSCLGLRELTIGESVAQIDDYAFLNCRKLAKIIILGKPSVGRQVFRSAGMDATPRGVEVLIDPALASDTDYMDALKGGIPSVTVREDAIVSSLKTHSVSLAPGRVTMTLSVRKASSWGVVNPASVKVRYWATLSGSAEILTPTAATDNGDGTLTVEVAVPEGNSGFLQAVME